MVSELLNLADLFDGHFSGFAVDDYGLLALYLLFQFERPSLRFIRTEPETSRSLSRWAVRGRSGGGEPARFNLATKPVCAGVVFTA